MDFLHHAKSVLKKNKQKLTTTRLWLLKQLASSTETLTAYDTIKKNPQASIDITTIYRNLELFESLQLIHKISSLWWYIACIHEHDCESHDIIICRDCSNIQETHIHKTTKKLLWLSQSSVELNGQCEKCEKKSSQ